MAGASFRPTELAVSPLGRLNVSGLVRNPIMSVGRLLFVANEVGFFLSHRLPLACAARNAGYEVHVAAPEGAGTEHVRANKFPFHPIPMSRKGISPLAEMGSMIAMYRLYRKLLPDIVHHVTIKPVLYGGLMARLARVRAVVSAVTGLGFVFVSRGFRMRMLRAGVKVAYRLALDHANSRVIFQNPDDRDLFVKERLLSASRAVLIKGSGVDMAHFRPSPELEGAPLVVLAARMLWDKGIGEFIEAVHKLRSEDVDARFVLVGASDLGNPAAVPESQLRTWHSEGVVEWWGQRNDMSYVLAQAHIVCLPSYREGLPKVLIEAAASGRPIVATDVPGCREITINDENGLLVRPRDVASLATALRRLIEDGDLRKRFGMRGREIAVAGFSIERVVDETLTVYRDLLA